MSNTFQNLLANNGIIHQVTCPYTPEQNWCAERKHCHLVETGLTLLFGAHMPTKYWPDAFLTATYLINRMAMKSLQHISLWEALFHHPSDYLTLCVFGCACYPYLRPYSLHKLDPRTRQCVMLGYNLNHKGYRCLDPSTRRLYLSHHVIFDESHFPFKKISLYSYS